MTRYNSPVTAIDLPAPRAVLDRAFGWIPWRATAVVLLVAIAYRYSLTTLVRGLALQTPLAYLGLVPIISLILGRIRLAHDAPNLPIHDRQADYIVGIGFLLAALGIVALLPATFGTQFWLDRLDLVSLPLFTAGTVAIVYGVRRLWTLKVPITFLLFAWPLPYTPLLGDAMDRFTEATAGALGVVSRFLPFAHPSPTDPTVFFVGTTNAAFTVAIGSACAGINSLVGFVLIGSALACIVRGSLFRRVLWLTIGLLFIWLLNIVRIEAIFIAGYFGGRAVALDVLHPIAGIIVFDLGVIVMLLAVRVFGLHLIDLSPARLSRIEASNPVRRVRPAFIVVVAVALVIATINIGFARYETIATPLGEATRQAPLDIRHAQVTGWTAQYVAPNPAAKQYFGDASTWDRILYSSAAGASLSSSIPVNIDVIDTPDPSTLAAYGVRACYSFHGYQIESTTNVDIGSGVVGQLIDYHDPKAQADWSAVVWEWPYAVGDRTWYERVIVFIIGGPDATLKGASTADVGTQAPRFVATDKFLASLARAIVLSQQPASNAISPG